MRHGLNIRHGVTMLALLLLSGCASHERAMSPSESYWHGVQFLIAAQNEDGSFGSFESARPGEIYLDNLSSHNAFTEATSALCVLALQEPSRSDSAAGAAMEKGLKYLLNSRLAGRASGSTFYDTWAHTYLVQCMASLHRDERFSSQRAQIGEIEQRELKLLAERQGAEGGFGYYDFGNALKTPTGHMSTSFNTAAVLLALHEAKTAGFAVDADVVHDALMCLERLRLPSGAYVYGTYAQMNPAAGYNQVKGSLGRSQSCNLALWSYQRQITQEELRKGLENLRKEHHFIEIGKGRPIPHEAWYFTAGYYFLFGHYYASGVINALEDSAARDDYRAWLAATMARLQDPDGSWFDFPLYGYHKCYGTAFGLLTLQQCGAMEESPVSGQVEKVKLSAARQPAASSAFP